MKFIVKLFTLLILLSSCQNPAPGVETTTTVKKPTSLDEKLTNLNEKVAQDSNDIKSLEERGDFYFSRGNFLQASHDFNSVIKLDSTYILGYHKLADAILNSMDTRTALVTIQSAARRFPNDIPTLMKEAKYELILGRFDDCRNTLKKLKKKDPQNAEVYLLIGKLGEETKDIKLAKSGYRTATEMDAGLMDAWKKIGDIYALERNKIAIKFYDNGLEVEPNNVSLLLGKGTFYFQNNQPEKAIETFHKVIINDPNNTLALYNTGLAYIALNDLVKAKENLEICLKTKPDFAQGYYFLGQIAAANKDKDEARRMYKQALVFDEKYKRAQTALDNLR